MKRTTTVLLLGVSLALTAAASTSAVSPDGSGRRALTPTGVTVVAQPSIRPELFSELATGVARIQVRTCGGRLLGQGTGFLIGDQVVMTARHVLEVKGGCSYRAILRGRSYTGERIAYWYTAGARDLEVADVATMKLDRPAPGHVFAFARRTPKLKTTIAEIGFPLGNPLSFNQGPLAFSRREEGIPVIGVRIAGAQGSSGSAFLDPRGNVVGIHQKGLVAGPGSDGVVNPAEGIVWGVNLVRWWGPQIARDLCRAYPQGGILGCDDAEPPPPPTPATCSNGRDDDGDGRVDYPADPGCSSPSDGDETDLVPPPADVTPGSYRGSTNTGDFVFFDVLQQRVVRGWRVNNNQNQCDQAGFYIYGAIDLGTRTLPIDAGGRFEFALSYTTTITWDENQDQTPANASLRIIGQIQGSSASGTLLTTWEFVRDGRQFRCSSGDKRWTATRVP